jgi:hypothetical protein
VTGLVNLACEAMVPMHDWVLHIALKIFHSGTAAGRTNIRVRTVVGLVKYSIWLLLLNTFTLSSIMIITFQMVDSRKD